MLTIIKGDIFSSNEKYIIHQCNAITKHAAHLAKSVFEHYPYADIYSGRTTPDKPGTIIVRGNGVDQRFVIALIGQYYPGVSKYPDSDLDGLKIREKYFHKALIVVARIPNLESVAMPIRIGCGAAGGNWINYYGTIVNFSNHIYATQGAKTFLYEY
jgi:O-acetyl-ADP-ribose deacetylase (regulator of RNase III)